MAVATDSVGYTLCPLRRRVGHVEESGHLDVCVHTCCGLSGIRTGTEGFTGLPRHIGFVNRYTQFTIFDNIEASVTDGNVVLSGWVTMPYKKNDIERRVRKIDGVSMVENKIDVLPVSQFDDELRYRIARAIYGNSSFWNYAAMANPPIHIVVDRGRVTLTGVVQSNVERMLARSLAVGFGVVRGHQRAQDRRRKCAPSSRRSGRSELIEFPSCSVTSSKCSQCGV